MAAGPSSVSATPPNVASPADLLRVHCPIIQMTYEALDLVLSLRDTISDMPASGLYATVPTPLVPVFWPIFNPIHCLLTITIHCQLVHYAAVVGGTKGFKKAKASNIHYFPSIHRASQFIIEGYQCLSSTTSPS